MFLIGFCLAWKASLLARGVPQRQPDCQVFSAPIRIQTCPGFQLDYSIHETAAERELCDDHGPWDESAKRTSLEDMLTCGVDLSQNHFQIEDDSRIGAEGYNRTGLMIAAEEGWTDIVYEIVSEEVDINEKDNLGVTAIMLASENGHKKVVHILWINGADFSETDENGEHTIVKATKRGHIKVVKYFLDIGWDVDLKCDLNNGTILSVAAAYGQDDIVSMLIKHWADVNYKNEIGADPLMAAAANGHDTTVTMLLENGADGVNMKNMNGFTSLMQSTKYPRTIAVLLDAGAEVNMQNTQDNGCTALMLAAIQGHSETVSILIDNGADVSITDKDGRAALNYAVSQGHFKIASTLIENGADVNNVNKNGETALMIAAKEGHFENVRGGLETLSILMDYGADANIADPDLGETALMYAASEGDFETVSILVDNGADVNILSKNGMTALMFAKRGKVGKIGQAVRGYDKVVALLKKY